MTDALFASQRLAEIYDPYVFAADGATLTSDSTRRFRTQAGIEGSLRSAGYTPVDVHAAPDRPGYEWVFIARTPGSG